MQMSKSNRYKSTRIDSVITKTFFVTEPELHQQNLCQGAQTAQVLCSDLRIKERP